MADSPVLAIRIILISICTVYIVCSRTEMKVKLYSSMLLSSEAQSFVKLYSISTRCIPVWSMVWQSLIAVVRVLVQRKLQSFVELCHDRFMVCQFLVAVVRILMSWLLAAYFSVNRSLVHTRWSYSVSCQGAGKVLHKQRKLNRWAKISCCTKLNITWLCEQCIVPSNHKISVILTCFMDKYGCLVRQYPRFGRWKLPSKVKYVQPPKVTKSLALLQTKSIIIILITIYRDYFRLYGKHWTC